MSNQGKKAKQNQAIAPAAAPRRNKARVVLTVCLALLLVIAITWTLRRKAGDVVTREREIC